MFANHLIADLDGWCGVVRYGRVECHADDDAGETESWARGFGGLCGRCGGDDDVVRKRTYNGLDSVMKHQRFKLCCSNTTTFSHRSVAQEAWKIMKSKLFCIGRLSYQSSPLEVQEGKQLI